MRRGTRFDREVLSDLAVVEAANLLKPREL